MTIVHATFETPFGAVQLTAKDDAIRSLHLVGQRHFAAPPQDATHAPDDALVAETAQQLRAFADGRLREFDLPLALDGTPGRLAVWEALRRIPYGETTTYGAIAAQLGRPGMAQSVGQSVGRNPIAIVVPCHRVIGADGSLTGYAGGLEVKRRLLEIEGVLQPRLVG